MNQCRTTPGSDSPAEAVPTFVKVIIFGWVLVVASENLKVEFLPYADWLATIPALACLLYYGRPHLTLAQGVFLTTIALSGFIDGDVSHAAIWSTKLAVIFLCISCLATVRGLPEVALLALMTLCVCNLVLFVLGQIGFSRLSEMMGAQGRYGTVLCHPGALWHVGIPSLAYFAYLFLYGGKQYAWALAGVLACLAVIWLDGSRTALLLVAGFCLLPVVHQLKRTPYLVCGVSTLIVLMVPLLSSLEIAEDTSLNRTVRLFRDPAGWTESLESWDSSRYEMLERSCELIRESPVLGNGFHAASIRLDEEVDLDQETMVVHSAYLQVWSNFGLAGVLAFTGLLWGWVPTAMDAYRASASYGIEHRAKVINAILTLAAVGVAQVFHPVSVVWSDWILFAVPFAMLAQSPVKQLRPEAQGLLRTVQWATT